METLTSDKQNDGIITVCINETDLISRDWKDCNLCPLEAAISRKTSKFAEVHATCIWLFDSVERREVGRHEDAKLFWLEPPFTKPDYNELRKKALNREKVFHYIKLIPVKP